MASSRFIADQQLTKKDLAAIQNYLAKIAHKWIDIGVQLQVDPDYLEDLKTKKNSSSKDSMRQMVLTWLKGNVPIPTWKALCDALRTDAVNELGVADRIEREKLLPYEEEADGRTPSQISSEPPQREEAYRTESPDPIPKSEDAVQQDTTTTPTSTSSSIQEPFPFLNTSGLSAKEKEELFERLQEESIRIRLAFISLVSDTEISLITRGVSVLSIHEELKSSNLHHCDRIAGLLDVVAVIGQLKEYLSFVDYSLLETIIQKLGTREDRDSLDKYKQSLADFSQRRVFECPEGMFGITSVSEDENEMVVKWTDTKTILYDLTLNQVKIFASILRKEVDMEDSDVRLMRCSKDDQSLELCFAVMSSVTTRCFPLSDDRKEHLISLGVWQLKCGSYTFEHEQRVILTDDVDGEEEDEQPKPEEKEASTTSEPFIEFKNTIISTDEDVGSHMSISINSKRLIVEVSSNTSSYKSYKVGRQRGGNLEWLSSATGLRYGMGRYPRIALNNEGFVVEVDEETNGHISCRVGLVHASNMMIWTESSIFTAGSSPSIAICHRMVIVAFKRADDAFYRIGTLDTEARSITWSAQEHRFVSGVSDLAIACNHEGIVISVYTKQMVTSALSAVYATVGTIQKTEKTIHFSSTRGSSQSLCDGISPSAAIIRDNTVIMTCVQQTGIQRKIKYMLGLVKEVKKTNSAYNVVWSASGGETLDTTGKKACVAMNDRGTVLISHSMRGKNCCHIGKAHIYKETTI